jgi:hypothetical protein
VVTGSTKPSATTKLKKSAELESSALINNAAFTNFVDTIAESQSPYLVSVFVNKVGSISVFLLYQEAP